MLIIIETGNDSDTIHVWGCSGLKLRTEEEVEKLFPLLRDTTVIPEAHYSFDSRESRSRRNTILCYHVTKEISAGKNVILLAPSAEMIDKRVRRLATVWQIPNSEGKLT